LRRRMEFRLAGKDITGIPIPVSHPCGCIAKIGLIIFGRRSVPWGFRQLLNHVHKEYSGPNDLAIIVTENGFAIADEHTFSLDKIIDDKERQEYFDLYLTELCEAVKEGVRIDGYMGWSLLE
jgi:beta-glucosidase/6-phospho-beta-glucosidase/beta-galactosidase